MGKSYTPLKLASIRHDPPSGSSGKPPVIFLHGMTACKENWGDLPKFTAETTGRTVYAVDARNHGDSPWSDEWDFDCNVDDLLLFLDSNDIARAVLVGHSMGGVTSFKTALNSPERVEKIFIEDMTTKTLDESLFGVIVTFLRLMKDSLRDVPAGLEEEEAKVLIMKNILENLPPELKPLAAQHFNPEYLHAKKDEIMSLKKDKDGFYSHKANLDVLLSKAVDAKSLIQPFEGKFEGPVSVCYGKQSPFAMGDDEQAVKDFFPNATLLGIEGASHTVHTDCPEEFREALFEFIAKE